MPPAPTIGAGARVAYSGADSNRKAAKPQRRCKFVKNAMKQKPYQIKELAPDCFDPKGLEEAYERVEDDRTIEEYIFDEEGNPNYFRTPLKEALNGLGMELPEDEELLEIVSKHREYQSDIQNEPITLVEFIAR
jgi:5-formaminoimidazole-4-carboxamide-1-beta-D-ribofuranosyl 5'-monophosphate synthetase